MDIIIIIIIGKIQEHVPWYVRCPGVSEAVARKRIHSTPWRKEITRCRRLGYDEETCSERAGVALLG